jgi:2-polyprenyl-6-methoxyphenol hydroxylase-like FAD-dependent oxidoreductase
MSSWRSVPSATMLPSRSISSACASMLERSVSSRCCERASAEDIAAMRAVTDGLQKLFSTDAVWVARLRNMGLAAVDKVAPLKNLLIRRAIA